MNLTKKHLKERWFDYDETTSFKIGPMPFSGHKSMEMTEMIVNIYMTCLLDWKGVKMDGKNFPFNDDNKKFIYDYFTEIRDFILEKARSFSDEMEDDEKN